MMLTDQDVSQLRAETPGCQERVHLNNAGAALSPQPVVDAVFEHLRLESEVGGYEAELARAKELQAVYASLARLVGGRADEIALTQNATRAWDMVFYGLELGPADTILTCRAEYASNYIAFLQRQKQTGCEIRVVPNNEQGALCLTSLEQMLDESVKVVALNHIPTNGGLVQPAKEVGELLKDHPAVYLLDACQSVGQLPLNVKELGCDALSCTSRKYLRGPRGLGFLWCDSELTQRLEPPLLDLHAARWVAPQEYQMQPDARRFETYEGFVAGRLGLGAAAEYALRWGPQRCWARLKALAEKARRGLRELPGITVHDLGEVKGGIVTFTHDKIGAEELQQKLSERGINIWTCSEFSARLDMAARGLSRVARASFHYYNTEDEVSVFLDTVQEIV